MEPQITQLLKGVEHVITGAQHCWLVTLSESGGVNARVMGTVTRSPAETDWTLCFLAGARSNKVRDIRAAANVRLIFERAEDAFVSLEGPATVVSDTATVVTRWQSSYERLFPTASAKANAVFLDIRTEEIRCWIRGLTPEPFGLQSLTLRRFLEHDWRIQPS